MRRTRGRLERRIEASQEALALPDGSRVLYTHPDVLRAVGTAAVRGEESSLLVRFLEADTTEGLCRALVGSRAGG